MHDPRENEAPTKAGPPDTPLPVLTGKLDSQGTVWGALSSLVLALVCAMLPIALAVTVTKLHMTRYISIQTLYRTQFVVTFACFWGAFTAGRLAKKSASFPQARLALGVSILAGAVYFVLTVAGFVGIFVLHTAG